ncbi:hypothetical protein [Bacillus swezeyi]|uniref:Uncharacterized protein n=1 Tax=Bacillus swezeyi TaxID=1925020 RepID=A0A5M8R825_9BACI|nr:hypothetical protein [Bacillus swezeyi]KAA6443588.1 hypothetical protein DX927_24915 [Bacillus swezeyi]KAA6473766.1 hypothetical protein DX928_20900 [Bacillus swezeyi]TYS31403.1 hypothetical protein FZC77_23540 [Bacillus swezeyi]
MKAYEMTKEEKCFNELLKVDGLKLDESVCIEWGKDQIDITHNNKESGFIMLSDVIEYLNSHRLLMN